MTKRESLKEIYKDNSSYVKSRLKEKFNLTEEETIRYFHMTYEKIVVKNSLNILKYLDSGGIYPASQIKDLYPELI